MVHSHSCEVEFVRGPFDGHVESMVAPLDAFLWLRTAARTTTLMGSVMRLVFGRRRPAGMALAVYELGSEPEWCGCRYHYLGTKLVTREQLRRQARRHSGKRVMTLELCRGTHGVRMFHIQSTEHEVQERSE